MTAGDASTGRPRRHAMRHGFVLALIITGGALADSAYAQTLDPGTVTVSDFTPVALSGNATTTTATMADFAVTDDAGLGWHVSVHATQFAEVNDAGDYVPGGKTLPVGSLAMPAPTVAPSDASVTVAAGPYLLDGATVQIATADDAAIGTYQFTHDGPLTLSLPSSAYARAYRSDVTVAVQSGP